MPRRCGDERWCQFARRRARLTYANLARARLVRFVHLPAHNVNMLKFGLARLWVNKYFANADGIMHLVTLGIVGGPAESNETTHM